MKRTFLKQVGWIPGRSAAANGSALVLTTLMLALMTVLVTVFLIRVESGRQVLGSSAARADAIALARSAGDIIAADLRREMLAGSEIQRNAGFLALTPRLPELWNPVPQLPGGGLEPPSGFENLIKQSTPDAAMFPSDSGFDGSEPLIPAASPVAAREVSMNGRVIPPARWDAPRLTAARTSDGLDPHWVFVARRGIPGSQVWENTWKSKTSTDRVTGRFAYRVYDVSGLLDINVAGYPERYQNRARWMGMLSWANPARGRIPGSELPLVSDLEGLVAWRNRGSAGSFANYLDQFGTETGLVQHRSGDQRFFSRQDLIRHAESERSWIPPEALPFLTTFTRTVNAPSWMPEDPVGSMIAYEDTMDLPGAVNRRLAGVRVRSGFRRRDGSEALPGEWLINSRFPLTTIGLLEDGDDEAAIRANFGLTREGGPETPWTPDLLNGRIRTLHQVAIANREPNFFELLKAVILRGSLAKTNGRNSHLTNYHADRSLDRQVLQIGANLIDQFDSDHEPTLISTASLGNAGLTGPVVGVENHPRISAMYEIGFRRKDRGNENSLNPGDPQNPHPWLQAFFQFQIWNPHVNAGASPGGEYRIVATGRCHVEVGKTAEYPNGPTGGTIVPADPEPLLLDGSALGFRVEGRDAQGLAVHTPRLLNSDRVDRALTDAQNVYEFEGAKIAGIFAGEVDVSNNLDGDGDNSNDYSQNRNGNPGSVLLVVADPQSPPRFQLQWKNPEGRWVLVQEVAPLLRGVGMGGGQPQEIETADGNTVPLRFMRQGIYREPFHTGTAYLFSDPRTIRFGLHGSSRRHPNQTLRPGNTNHGFGLPAWANFNPNAPFWTVAPNLAPYERSYAPAELAENRETSATYVADRDGVVRPADGTPGENVFAGRSIARPFFLNRPFRSASEMAHASRDDPWKTLDFSTEVSADSALLDVFSVTSAPVQAGVVNLERAPLPVVQAVLASAPLDPARTGLNTDLDAIASAIVVAVSQLDRPIRSRAGLSRVVGALDRDLTSIKRHRELPVRAFGDILNQRTWNLMVDVIAQSGDFPESAGAAADFQVRSEARLWMHIAIDRLTGEIVEVRREQVIE